MENKKKRIVIALGGNALGNTLPEQMIAVKITAKAIVDLIEEGCEVIVAHGNGPQVGMINNAMAALSREDANQPNTPLSVCVAMSQAYIGYDLQNALREELYNREMYNIPGARCYIVLFIIPVLLPSCADRVPFFLLSPDLYIHLRFALLLLLFLL